MGLFDFKRKKSPEEVLRDRLRSEFENRVAEALVKSLGDPFYDALLVQASVGNFYQSMKNSQELNAFCSLQGIDYQDILSDECTKVLKKYTK